MFGEAAQGHARRAGPETDPNSHGEPGPSVIGRDEKPKKEKERAAHCTFYKPIIIKIVFLNLCFIFRALLPLPQQRMDRCFVL